MNDWRSRSEDRKEDVYPPFSRIFVVCSKNFKEEELKKPFLKFGDIENFYMPRDRQTGESKGVAYIKYCLTSSAAAAIQELDEKCIGNCNKPIKVMVANHKDDKDRTKVLNKYVRLFIKISQTDTEATIEEHFSTFGELHSVYIIRNKWKVAYVTYNTFYDAAKAYEQCDNKYKAVFAAPKDELKRGRDSFEQNMGSPSMSSCSLNKRDKFNDMSFKDNHLNGNPAFLGHPNVSQRISVTVSPPLDEKYIRSLFNIVPGMEDFQYSQDLYNGVTKAIITYGDQNSTACAMERLNNFQFPSGEIVSVTLDNPITKAATEISNMVKCLKSAIGAGDPSSGLVQLADAIAQASSLIKVATTGKTEQDSWLCSVPLPPVQPMSDAEIVAKRCFIVCKPRPPPFSALQDVFCRFGDLIDIKTYPNKTFGFVKYASEKAAQEAIKTLHGATVCGVFLKVLEADDKQTEIVDIEDRKRIKINEDRQLVECIKD